MRTYWYRLTIGQDDTTISETKGGGYANSQIIAEDIQYWARLFAEQVDDYFYPEEDDSE